MQFKHPEILWFLPLLLIPIIIHLFQLRRFTKTPFTNVAMLKLVISESRKSNTLKKWLLLLTRLLLLGVLVMAFAQPFAARPTALRPVETVIYLDDSFSMQAKKEGISLLEKAVQDLIKTIPKENTFSIFTNTQTYSNVTLDQVQNKLLGLRGTGNQLQFKNMVAKANNLFSNAGNTTKNLIVISDFQERMGAIEIDSLAMQLHAVQLSPTEAANVSLDSVYLEGQHGNQLQLNLIASGLGDGESTSVSLFNDGQLIAKTALLGNATTTLSIPGKQQVLGRLVLNDASLPYDNTFYFTLDERPRINVLAIGEAPSTYLNRIFTEEEFTFSQATLATLDYSQLAYQNLIILNELATLPKSLQTALAAFLDDGGSLAIVPDYELDMPAYNEFLQAVMGVRLDKRIDQAVDISGIAFDHPHYEGVFERSINNFQYPTSSGFYTISGNASRILSFSNQAPFLVAGNSVYLFTSPLNLQQSTFQNSPLIVPTFYKMGSNSLKLPVLYFFLGEENQLDLPIILERDNIVRLTQNGGEFIPAQQSFPNKVTLTVDENITKEGIFAITKQKDTLMHLALNHKRNESDLRYKDLGAFPFANIGNSIPTVFDQIAQENSIDAHWKWFVIFAVALALVELLLQKFLA